MSKQIEANPSRISFAPGRVDAQKLDEIADELGYESRADFIRDTLANRIATHTEASPSATLHQPDNDELADAYDKLLDLSDHPRGSRAIGVEEARDQLWTQRCPKTAVKDRLLRPLAEGGFIAVAGGQIHVRRRTEEQVAQAEQEGDATLNKLKTTSPSPPPSETRTPEQEHIAKYQRGNLNVPFRLGAWVASQVVWTEADR
ncbi:ribbon-helix-helix domain-containing protein [Halosegnis longus]|uniref:ribbon-helix-helix domain-containing protein n=1 Tax=Halosegnis longus TaxID=2216012 RepID=UPI00129E97E9|nr:ribbon-helix-helix domain-containing protein [Halosegnis longus]